MVYKKSYQIIIPVILMTFLNIATMAQMVMPLYPGKIPNSKNISDREKSETRSDSILIISKVTVPTLTMYAPAKRAAGAAVIICPGGGYAVLAAGHEGADVAKRFNEMGITAFVLKYRLPDDSAMQGKEIGPLQDAQQAVLMVRQNAKKWNINAKAIGIMGFSAGGHLASTAGTHFNKSYIPNLGHISLRPDFMILAYPVISFTDSIGHIGSRDNLIGKLPALDKIEEYSNELHVSSKTPPTFLMHAKDDDAVNVKNTLYFEKALRKNNVPVEIYLYEKGGHGFGMKNPTSKIRWMDMVESWMKKMKFL